MERCIISCLLLALCERHYCVDISTVWNLSEKQDTGVLRFPGQIFHFNVAHLWSAERKTTPGFPINWLTISYHFVIPILQAAISQAKFSSGILVLINSLLILYQVSETVLHHLLRHQTTWPTNEHWLLFPPTADRWESVVAWQSDLPAKLIPPF